MQTPLNIAEAAELACVGYRLPRPSHPINRFAPTVCNCARTSLGPVAAFRGSTTLRRGTSAPQSRALTSAAERDG